MVLTQGWPELEPPKDREIVEAAGRGEGRKFYMQDAKLPSSCSSLQNVERMKAAQKMCKLGKSLFGSTSGQKVKPTRFRGSTSLLDQGLDAAMNGKMSGQQVLKQKIKLSMLCAVNGSPLKR